MPLASRTDSLSQSDAPLPKRQDVHVAMSDFKEGDGAQLSTRASVIVKRETDRFVIQYSKTKLVLGGASGSWKQSTTPNHTGGRRSLAKVTNPY